MALFLEDAERQSDHKMNSVLSAERGCQMGSFLVHAMSVRINRRSVNVGAFHFRPPTPCSYRRTHVEHFLGDVFGLRPLDCDRNAFSGVMQINFSVGDQSASSGANV